MILLFLELKRPKYTVLKDHCDFPERDVKFIIGTTKEVCGVFCAAEPSCSHFAWAVLSGRKRCHFKNIFKDERPVDKSGVSCGLVSARISQ